MDMFSQVFDNLKFLGLLIITFMAFVTIADIALGRHLREHRSRKNVAARTPQAEALGSVAFKRQSLMNRTEFRVFATVERVLARANSGHRVMAQTSLGEVLCTERPGSDPAARKAYAVINCKRLDMAIIDRSGFVALAIEVQGAGHYKAGDAFIRDAVKKEALRRAGIELLEVTPDWDAERIFRDVSHRLGLPFAA